MTSASMEWIAGFERLRVEPEHIHPARRRVLVLTRHIGLWKESGLAWEHPFGDVVTVRKGRIVGLEQYGDRAEALKAAGLQKADLGPT